MDNGATHSFKIDSSVPLPPPFRGRGFHSSPWQPEALAIKELDIGQSVFFPGLGSKVVTARINRVKAINKKHSYAQRRVNEGGQEGVRVWRLK